MQHKLEDSSQVRHKVLVVDDSDINRIVMRSCLANEGYILEEAEDGFQALVQIAQDPPDLVLLDIMMPGMNGFDVCRRIRRDARTKVIPVVLVTALSDVDERVKGIEAGADDFITKPFHKAEVRARVRQLIKLNHLRQLITERDRFDAVMDAAVVGIATFDDKHRLHSANGAARRMLGLSGTATGQALGAMFAEQPLEASARAELEGDADVVLFELVRGDKDAPATVLECRLTRSRGSDGSLAGAVMVIRDVTDEHRQARMKSSFLELITHKLRTPLAGLAGVAELLDDPDLDADDVSELAPVLTERVGHLQQLFGQLLDFVSVTGSLQRDPSATTPAINGLDEAADRLTVTYPDKTVVFERRGLDAVQDLAVDPGHLGLVYNHVIDNAVKFAADKAVNVCITAEVNGGFVTISITDDGPGIPAEEHEKVFEPFHQVEQSFTGNVEGAGLGLAAVRQIVDLYGGDASIDGGEGAGTTVIMKFPVAARVPSAA